jgi:phosphoribosylformylglycinamidine synthase
MLSRLKELIPRTEHWPKFVENTSQQFEASFSMVKIQDNPVRPSVFFHGMNGSTLPIVVSHGEGRVHLSLLNSLQELSEPGMIPVRYVDNRLSVTEQYPYNPNGSPAGVAGVSSEDGRVLAVMPHPERTSWQTWVATYHRKSWKNGVNLARGSGCSEVLVSGWDRQAFKI